MSRYQVVVVYTDGTRSVLGAEAPSAADAREEIISRLAEQFIEWPPSCCPRDLEFAQAGSLEPSN
jgi:hypothetical protein